LSQGQRQQVFQQVLCRPGPENSLQFTVARGWGRSTSGLPSSWLLRRLADQSEEGLESGGRSALSRRRAGLPRRFRTPVAGHRDRWPAAQAGPGPSASGPVTLRRACGRLSGPGW
jgi:hypothetical protein